MKITFEEILRGKEWLHAEMLRSLTGDLIDKAINDGFYDIKLLVNGVELEPIMFNDIVNNIDEYVDNEAQKLINDKLEEADNQAQKLTEMIREATYKIREEFDISEE